MSHLLEVKQLHTHFYTSEGTVHAVNGVDFTLERGETLAIVGESGSGKSVTSMSILGLVGEPGKVVGGEVLLSGLDLLKLKRKEYRRLRGKEISIIFQEPMTSLNPVLTIGYQVAEMIRIHEKISRKEAKVKVKEMLARVGIANAEKVASSFPHQLSGGMRQRVMIAIALACKPKLLIADEPTTALDVTIQAQILQIIAKLAKEENTGVILITHDLGVVAEMADRVAVMYAGEVVEEANVYELFHAPRHPYTKGLLASIPNIHTNHIRLQSIPGTVPNLLVQATGCPFAARCSYADANCRKQKPEIISVPSELRGEYNQATCEHKVRCLKIEEVATDG